MHEPDTAAILPDGEVSTTVHKEQQEEEEGGEAGVPTVRSVRPPVTCSLPVSVEPVLFLSMFSLALQAPLCTQYLWDRISEDLGYNGTKRPDCTNGSAEPDPLQKVTAFNGHSQY